MKKVSKKALSRFGSPVINQAGATATECVGILGFPYGDDGQQDKTGPGDVLFRPGSLTQTR